MKYFILLIIFVTLSCSDSDEKQCEFIDITYTDQRDDFIFICRSDNTMYFRNYFIKIDSKYTTNDCINIMPESNSTIKILQVTSQSIEFNYQGKTYIHTK